MNHSPRRRNSNWAFLLVLLALIPSICIAQQQNKSSDAQATRPELHVLFIGNSFTYFHNMPKVLETISSGLRGPHIKTEMVAVGGARLKDNWEKGAALAAIHNGRWDYVVLNEQSALGDIFIVNQQMQIADPANFFKYAALFDAEIRKAGAKTVILMTWKDKIAPLRNQQALNSAFVQFARTSAALLAPVSLAWQRITETKPGISLYFSDDHHPSQEGSYLIACTLYSVITGRSPTGAVIRAKGTPIDEDEGTVLEGKSETLVDVSPEAAADIQEIAWTSVQTVTEAGGYPSLPDAPPVVLPSVPSGQRPSISDLEGVWRGQLRFYPGKTPIEFELNITNSSSELVAALHVFYKGARPDVELTLANFQITEQGIFFTDPEGPNKGKIEFSGAYRSGSLAGVAKTLLPNADPAISVFGTWELKKTSDEKNLKR